MAHAGIRQVFNALSAAPGLLDVQPPTCRTLGPQNSDISGVKVVIPYVKWTAGAGVTGQACPGTWHVSRDGLGGSGSGWALFVRAG